MTDPKNWKHILQQTGLPLEQSVKRIMSEHGLVGCSELQFERTSETGVPITSSVDVVGSLVTKDQGIDATFLVECKHRHDGIQWLFAPERLPAYKSPTRRTSLHFVSEFCEEYQATKKLDFKVGTRLVGKGVEIKGSDSVDLPIRTALYQLRYGFSHLFLNYLQEVLHKPFGEFDPFAEEDRIRAFSPIIVTTADLHVLKKDVGYEEVRCATSMNEVAEAQQILLIHDPVDPVVRRELLSVFRGAFEPSKIQRADAYWQKKWGYRRFSGMLETFAQWPTFIHVMTYERFSASFGGIKKWLNESDLEAVL